MLKQQLNDEKWDGELIWKEGNRGKENKILQTLSETLDLTTDWNRSVLQQRQHPLSVGTNNANTMCVLHHQFICKLWTGVVIVHIHDFPHADRPVAEICFSSVDFIHTHKLTPAHKFCAVWFPFHQFIFHLNTESQVSSPWADCFINTYILS